MGAFSRKKNIFEATSKLDLKAKNGGEKIAAIGHEILPTLFLIPRIAHGVPLTKEMKFSSS